MKAQLQLPRHPSVIFLICVFDLFVLVAVYGLYATNWVGAAGIPLKLTSLEAQNLTLSEHHIAVRLYPEPAENCLVGINTVPFTELGSALQQIAEASPLDQVLLVVDHRTSVERERYALQTIQELNMECVLVAEPKPNND